MMVVGGLYPLVVRQRATGEKKPMSCCNTNEGYIARRYYTREERVAWLTGYADELETELKAVKERIASIQAA